MLKRILMASALLGVMACAQHSTSQTESARLSRACIMPAGGWTIVNCSAGAAYSAALTVNSRYVLQAISGNPYLAWGIAGSGVDADSNDGYLPDGAWAEFMTTSTIKYFSCDGSADGSSIRYFECQ